MADDLILITGGTGSFGHAYLRHAGAERVRIFSRDEEKQRRMAAAYPAADFVIGDVRDRAAVRRAMRGVRRVFHAAALKQVPQGEAHPGEYTRTNIIGTENVCAEAAEAGAQLVYLSTDKALEPVSIMGATKFIGEAVARYHGFNSVRYGNVVGSRGSIIPVWRQQMAAGDPITITDAGMTRFLITLPEAIELVDVAFEAPADGSVYVRKSPAATVAQVARVFAAGHPIREIGVRAGEKRHEDLVIASENVEDLGPYFRVRPEPGHGGITYSSEFACYLEDAELAELLSAAPNGDYG